MPESLIKPAKRIFDPPIPIVTLSCLTWCAAVFLVLGTRTNPPVAVLHQWGLYGADEIFNGAWWALFTTAFVHVEPTHFFFNMYWLYFLGPVLEREIGSARLLAFVLGGAFVSSSMEALAGHSGIGFSGVGYAIAGFGWIAAKYKPELKAAFSDRTITLFVGWGVLCIVLTMLHMMNVGNIAHGTGFVFGILVALGSYKKSLAARAAATLLIVVSAVHINWNPYSSHWVYAKAGQAMDRHDYDRAIVLLKKSLELGLDEATAWDSLAQIYGYQQKPREYAAAIAKLRSIDQVKASEVITKYGEPEVNSPSP